ncbi:MAG: putative secreted protein, partial [Anaerocolumna sp.]|nr:putative secreted protein [Anaerocolumna sp.]
MIKKNGINVIISIFLIVYIISSIFISYSASAGVVDESSSSFTVQNSNKEDVLTVIMSEGVITIVAKSKAATSAIRWETIGINISEGPIVPNTTTKGRIGPGPVSSAYGLIEKPLKFDKAFSKTDSDPINGIVTTTIIFNAEQVNAALGKKLEYITKGTPIYLHAVFHTYDYDYMTDKKTTRTTDIVNWKDIMNAEPWGKEETLDDFVKYFNMKIKFMPKIEHTMYYETEAKVKLKDDKILKEDDKLVKWKNEETELKDENGNAYELIGYYVAKKSKPREIIDSYYLKDGWTLDEIRTSQNEAYQEGTAIHMVYAPQEDATHTLYYETETKATLIGSKKLTPTDENGTKVVKWSKESKEIPKNNITYELIGYYVCNKNKPNVVIKSRFLSEGATLTEIQTNKHQAYKEGTAVHLVYKSPDDIGNVEDPTPIPGETISVPMNMPEATGVIRADNRGSERFIATEGVPTTESLYTEVKATGWTLGYTFQKQVGIETYAVPVTRDYILTWTVENEDEEEELFTDTIRVTKVVNIKRAYGYWEILNFDLFKISSATVNNYALPGGTSFMTPNSYSGYNPPYASINHSSSKDDHLIIPYEIKNGLMLPAKTISGSRYKPSIPNEDFKSLANSIIPELSVKNDNLSLYGTIIMDSSVTLKEGPRFNESYINSVRETGIQICNENVLYKPNQIIEATKKNGIYNSSGVIVYTGVNGINSYFNDTIQNNINGLNSVVIHTPVYCEPVITADNDKYVQLLKPSPVTQLVLEPQFSYNDFELKISNYGMHSYKQGYYTRDFSRSLRDPVNVSYIANSNELLRNEVKFPFDVFIKGTSKDTFVKKNTWIIIGRDTVHFYLPMWVVEGIYRVECRSIAVNADFTKLELISEFNKNTDLFNYVATNTFDVEVSGRLYGLSVYDLTDYPLWQEVFRVDKSLDLKINDPINFMNGTDKPSYSKSYYYNYTVGTNNQYGVDTRKNVKYTFPLVNGSHPKYENIGVLKTGYVVRFKLNTIGTLYSSKNMIKFKPSFYFVDSD